MVSVSRFSRFATRKATLLAPEPANGASVLPTELIFLCLAPLGDSFPPDSHTLSVASQLNKHWRAHGTLEILYSSIHLAHNDSILALERTISRHATLAQLIGALNFLPAPLEPSFGPDTLEHRYRHWPDDGSSTRATVRILKRTPNLHTLSIKVVEFHHRRMTFSVLARSISSPRLARLTLSGDMGGWMTRTFLESLLPLLCAPPCASLERLVLLGYSFNARTGDWSDCPWTRRLPSTLAELWPGEAACYLHRSRSYEALPLEQLLTRPLDVLAFGPREEMLRTIMSFQRSSWTELTRLCAHSLPRVVEAHPTHFPSLRDVELYLPGDSERTDALVHALHKMDNLRTLVFATSHPERPFGRMRRVAELMNELRLVQTIRSLRLRVQIERDLVLYTRWKVLSAALALKMQHRLAFGLDLWIGLSSQIPHEAC